MNNSWQQVRLREVLSLDLDRVKVDVASKYPMVGVLSFGRGLFDREPVENGKTSYKFFYSLKASHVVMSQLFGWEGALALSSPSFAGKFVSPQFPTFLCDETRLDRRYLGWAIRRPMFWEDLGTRASGMGDRRRTLTPEALFACQIPLPPLPEQWLIVAWIEELAAKIEEACTLRRKAAGEGELLLESYVSRLCRSPIWRTMTVGELVGQDSLRNGRSVKSSGDFGEVRCLTLSAVRNGHIDISDNKIVPLTLTEAEPFLIRKDDVFVVRGNGSKNLCGMAGLVTEDTDSVIFPDLFIHVPLPKQLILPEFFVAAWNSAATREVIEEKAKTTSGIWKVNQGHIISTGIPVPPLSEQRRIVAELIALQAQVDGLKKLQAATAAELDAMLPSILDKAFKGELGLR